MAGALLLCACGRAGPEQLPPSAAGTPPAPAASTAAAANPAAATANADAVNNGFDAQGNPVAPPGQKKSFPLDPLLR